MQRLESDKGLIHPNVPTLANFLVYCAGLGRVEQATAIAGQAALERNNAIRLPEPLGPVRFSRGRYFIKILIINDLLARRSRQSSSYS